MRMCLLLLLLPFAYIKIFALFFTYPLTSFVWKLRLCQRKKGCTHSHTLERLKSFRFTWSGLLCSIENNDRQGKGTRFCYSFAWQYAQFIIFCIWIKCLGIASWAYRCCVRHSYFSTTNNFRIRLASFTLFTSSYSLAQSIVRLLARSVGRSVASRLFGATQNRCVES